MHQIPRQTCPTICSRMLLSLKLPWPPLSSRHRSLLAPFSSSSSPSSLFCSLCYAQVGASSTTQRKHCCWHIQNIIYSWYGWFVYSRDKPGPPEVPPSSAPHPSSLYLSPSSAAPSWSYADPPRFAASEAVTQWLCFPRTCYSLWNRHLFWRNS